MIKEGPFGIVLIEYEVEDFDKINESKCRGYGKKLPLCSRINNRVTIL